MRILWTSDIHLNFLTQKPQRQEFYQRISELMRDAVLVTGDIAESHNVVSLIEEMQEELKIPVYFVLGNHDFYGSSVKEVKQSVKHLHYIPKNTGIVLSKETILLGVDGWGDFRNGEYTTGRLIMNDWLQIKDLRKGNIEKIKIAAQKLADKDAKILKRRILRAINKGYKNILIASHVPPFAEACLHAGQKSTEAGLPFFSSKILGDTVWPIANENPTINFIWFSGHTHSRCEFKPLDNFIVRVAEAQYFLPKIEAIIEIEYDMVSII